MFHAYVKRGCYWDWMLRHGLVQPQMTGRPTNDEVFDSHQHGAARRAPDAHKALHDMLKKTEIAAIREMRGLPVAQVAQGAQQHARDEPAGPSRLPVEKTATDDTPAWNEAINAVYAPVTDPDGSHWAYDAALDCKTSQPYAYTEQEAGPSGLQGDGNGEEEMGAQHAWNDAGSAENGYKLVADADGLAAAAAFGYTINANGWLVGPAQY